MIKKNEGNTKRLVSTSMLKAQSETNNLKRYNPFKIKKDFRITFNSVSINLLRVLHYTAYFHKKKNNSGNKIYN